jgi:two-component system, chemotaxis family, response regulator PixG
MRMNTISLPSQRPFQRLHPLSLLAQLISRNANSCLQVVSGSTSWSIYFDQGKLSYATSSADPFERLDRHLRQLSRQVPTVVSAVRVQVRLLFETGSEADFATIRDYQAIQWLVNQHHLDVEQAVGLVSELAKEVIEPFLALQEGSYEIVDANTMGNYPNLCQLDLRPIVEDCQRRFRQRQIPSQPVQPSPIAKPNFTGQRNVQRLSRFTQATAPTPTPTIADDRGNEATPIQSVTTNRYTIACVDDSPTILEAIKSFLDDSSFSVTMINDPVKALMQIVRTKPDLILLDVGMPNLDGYELCSLLRRHPSFKNTPIIMVTGLTGFIDRAKAKLVGSSGYLTKPFTQSELLKTVFKHLT